MYIYIYIYIKPGPVSRSRFISIGRLGMGFILEAVVADSLADINTLENIYIHIVTYIYRYVRRIRA